MRKAPTLKALQKIVDKFNADFPVGTSVILKKDTGIVETVVEAPAEILGGHSAVGWFHGVRGCYAIDDRVSAVESVLNASVNSIALLPCPFCGGAARFWTSPSKRTVACEACGIELSKKEVDKSRPLSESECVMAWNTRSMLPDVALPGSYDSPFLG